MIRNEEGFMLLEFAIVLVILGAIAGLFFPLITTLSYSEKTKRTELHKEQILYALASYVLHNSHLPCPAKSGAGEQKEECKAKEQCIGILPYRDLGLPEQVAKDGYGHWFTYAVEPLLTQTKKIGDPARGGVRNAEKGVDFCDIGGSGITLKDAGTRKEIEVGQENPTAIVLVSHGPEGTGAYTHDGAQKTPTQNDLEEINAAQDLNFVVGSVKDYRHQVYWVNRDLFLYYYARIYFGIAQQGINEGNGERVGHKQDYYQFHDKNKFNADKNF